MPHVNPIKPKIMKLAHIGKSTFNINGTTIHSTLVIPSNKKLNELKKLNDIKHNTLIKTYDQL
jgi:hypothetical protein